MDKMRARFEGTTNPEDLRYQKWNHPYYDSNFHMQKKPQSFNNINHQPLYANL